MLKLVLHFVVSTFFLNFAPSNNKKEMWEIYDDIHADEVDLISDSAIIDSCVQ